MTVKRIIRFLNMAGRRDSQYGADSGLWVGRIEPDLAWTLAGILTDYDDVTSNWIPLTVWLKKRDKSDETE